MRDLYDKIVFHLLYRRLLLRRTIAHESVSRPRLKLGIARVWDLLFASWLPEPASAADMVLVVPAGAKGWILDAICKEIAAHFVGRCRICYDHRSLPACHPPGVTSSRTTGC